MTGTYEAIVGAYTTRFGEPDIDENYSAFDDGNIIISSENGFVTVSRTYLTLNHRAVSPNTFFILNNKNISSVFGRLFVDDCWVKSESVLSETSSVESFLQEDQRFEEAADEIDDEENSYSWSIITEVCEYISEDSGVAVSDEVSDFVMNLLIETVESSDQDIMLTRDDLEDYLLKEAMANIEIDTDES